MDPNQSFDLNALLRQETVPIKTNKWKPAQFSSVAEGTTKRRQSTAKARKSTRLTIFDTFRALEQCQSPPPKTVAQIKLEQQEHRRQQLEKWKEDKEAKKKQEAAQKKRPFLAGASKYVPPPPRPVTVGIVTRSQARAQAQANNKYKFAPLDAGFAPNLKNVSKIPTLRVTRPQKQVELVIPGNQSTDTESRSQESKKVGKAITAAKSRINEKAIPSTSSTKTTSTRNTAKKPVTARQSQVQAMQSKVTITKPKQDKLRVAASNKRFEKNEANATKRSQKLITKLASSSSSENEPPNPKRNLCNAKVTKFTQTSSSSSDIEPSKVKRRTPFSKPPQKLSKVAKPSLSSPEEELNLKHRSFDQRQLRRKSFRQVSQNTVTPDSMDEQTAEPLVVSDSTTSIKELSSKQPTLQPSLKTPKSISIEKLAQKEIISMDNLPEQSPILKPVSSHICTPKANTMPRSESSSEEKLRTSGSYVPQSVRKSKSELTPEQIEKVMNISPRVTVSRGKANARQETVWKYNEGLLDEDVCDMDDVAHFRKQLSSEITRLTQLCTHWEQVAEQTVLPKIVKDHIKAEVGKTRLLVNSKLQQFASLVDRCEQPQPGSNLITPSDLQGFWDLVFLQVEKVTVQFMKLDRLQARDWREDSPPPPRPPPAEKPVALKRRAKAPATSRLREIIAAARKAKKDPQTPQTALQPEEKLFEAGFFCVRSPVRSPQVPHTPQSGMLYKAVLSSEAKKASRASVARNSASFAMLRASVISKDVTMEGIGLLPQQTPEKTPPPPPPVSETPIRSILKSSNKSHKKSLRKPNCKLVLFDDSHTEMNKENNTENVEILADSGTSSMELEDPGSTKKPTPKATENKSPHHTKRGKTTPKTKKLTRQDAVESLEDSSVIIEEETQTTKVVTSSRRVTRSRKSAQTAEDTTTTEEVCRRTTRSRKSAVL